MSCIKKLFVLLFASLALAVPAIAAPVLTYTISGIGSGSLNGSDFINADYVITMVGDAGTFDGDDVDPLLSASVTIAGFGTADLLIETRLGIYNDVVYFSRAGWNSADLFDFFLLGGPVDITQPFGPVVGSHVFALNQFTDVDSSLGDLTFRTSSDVLFQAVGAQAVPEPTSLALAAAALFGAAAVRRRRQLRA